MFSPDRGHVHHRLIDMGLTQRRAVMLLYGVSVLLMVSAIAIALGRSWESGVALLVASVVLTGLIRFVGYFEYVRLRRGVMLHRHDRRTRALRRLVPRLTLEIAQLDSEDQIWTRLVQFAAAAGCAVMYFEGKAPGTERHWPANPAPAEAKGLIFARFGLAPAGSLEFGFECGEDMSPQSDILLQLVADAVEAALAAQPMAVPAASASIDLSPDSGPRTNPPHVLAAR
jgi:UDP-GlcNAc:undecaprenyl-phosphate GlcNAc-1-phosphate transferase